MRSTKKQRWAKSSKNLFPIQKHTYEVWTYIWKEGALKPGNKWNVCSGIPFSNIAGTSTRKWVVTGGGLPVWVTLQLLQSLQQRWAMRTTKEQRWAAQPIKSRWAMRSNEKQRWAMYSTKKQTYTKDINQRILNERQKKVIENARPVLVLYAS